MLGVFCARPRPCFLVSHYAHGLAASFDRLLRTSSLHHSPPPPPPLLRDPTYRAPFQCPPQGTGAASIWNSLLPSYWRRRRAALLSRHDHDAVNPGEGSWNVAWDARPARWLHHPDSAWLLFGASASMAAAHVVESEPTSEVSVPAEELIAEKPCKYRVIGVLADGRCLFRAIARNACLRNGGEAPDENRETELADELRAQVVEELLKRREEVEWFLDEDFDKYVKGIEQPFAWGGEPELLMASHVLRTSISVYMKEEGTENFIKIADYGKEYEKDEEDSPINVVFHGYGHYDILETMLESR
ncbi:uncharacterized protein LOC127241527 [Andrographis paniculata]|uniref:uncharacterized protein LOC127241527 n=1 Tax=Andrographis paniculata TaxID=175694 RepID=UPI0021E8BC8A|nr:uncharacterized protein LOC127241527 [Andrographis paniculata]